MPGSSENHRFIDIAFRTSSAAFTENRRLNESANILLGLANDLEAGGFGRDCPGYHLHDSNGQHCGEFHWDSVHSLAQPGMRVRISFEGNPHLSGEPSAAQMLSISAALRLCAETVLNADPHRDVSELFTVKGVSALLTDYQQHPDLAVHPAMDPYRKAAIDERVSEAMMGVNDQLKVIERGLGTTEETDIIRQEMKLLRQLLDGSYTTEPQLNEEIEQRAQSLLKKKRSDDVSLSF